MCSTTCSFAFFQRFLMMFPRKKNSYNYNSMANYLDYTLDKGEVLMSWNYKTHLWKFLWSWHCKQLANNKFPACITVSQMTEWARELVLIFIYFSHLKLCNAWYWCWAEGDTSWHLLLKLTFFWVTCLNCAGNSSSAILDGSATMTLLRFGEEYVMSLPYAHCKGGISIINHYLG